MFLTLTYIESKQDFISNFRYFC